MKFSKSLFVMVVSVIFIAVSCKAPSVSKNEAYEDGAIGITVKLPAAAGRAAFTQDDAASYKIEMSLNETVVQTKTGLPGQTVTLKVEVEGLYTVIVTAYDATEREIAKGSATADLKFGDGIVPLQIKIRGYKKEIEIVPEIIWEDEEEQDEHYTLEEFAALLNGDDITESEHVKVENVPGGLKFTIRRPAEDCFNPNAVLKEEVCKDEKGNPVYGYDYVEPGNGDYNWIQPEYVGAGNGDYIEIREEDDYGDYWYRYEYVGAGNGDYNNGYFEYAGVGEGCYNKSDEPITNKYYGGYSWVAIYREEVIEGKVCYTTVAQLDTVSDSSSDILECFYPLVEPGKKCVFNVLIEPLDSYEYFENKLCEEIVITPEDGIGDIDYSNVDKDRKFILSYDGEKPILKLLNYFPEFPSYVRNLRTKYDIMIGKDDWTKKYETRWLTAYTGNCIEYEISKDPYYEDLKLGWYTIDENGEKTEHHYSDAEIEAQYRTYNFKNRLESTDKNEFYAIYYYLFDLPVDCYGIREWRALEVRSNVVKFR
nr:hypothetical protein [uncultured Treponema sp.]